MYLFEGFECCSEVLYFPRSELNAGKCAFIEPVSMFQPDPLTCLNQEQGLASSATTPAPCVYGDIYAK